MKVMNELTAPLKHTNSHSNFLSRCYPLFPLSTIPLSSLLLSWIMTLWQWHFKQPSADDVFSFLITAFIEVYRVDYAIEIDLAPYTLRPEDNFII